MNSWVLSSCTLWEKSTECLKVNSEVFHAFTIGVKECMCAHFIRALDQLKVSMHASCRPEVCRHVCTRAHL